MSRILQFWGVFVSPPRFVPGTCLLGHVVLGCVCVSSQFVPGTVCWDLWGPNPRSSPKAMKGNRVGHEESWLTWPMLNPSGEVVVGISSKVGTSSSARERETSSPASWFLSWDSFQYLESHCFPISAVN